MQSILWKEFCKILSRKSLPYRENAYTVRGVCTNTVGRGFTPAAFVCAKSRMRGVREVAPYGIVGCVHHAHVFKRIAEAGGATRDHRRCVNALAAGEGNLPYG